MKVQNFAWLGSEFAYSGTNSGSKGQAECSFGRVSEFSATE